MLLGIPDPGQCYWIFQSDPQCLKLILVPVTDQDTSEVTFVQDPSINLTKAMSSNADEDGSGDVSAGDTLTYTFNVTNDGNVNLNPVSVDDPMTGLSDLSCSATSLVPGVSMTCTATYTVTQADVDVGSIYTWQQPQALPTGEDVTDMDDEDVTVPSPSTSIDKTLTDHTDADGSGDVSAGDTLTYQITVTNNGTANLTNVVVSDDLTGDNKTCPLVIPDDTCVLNVTYVVNSNDWVRPSKIQVLVTVTRLILWKMTRT